MSGDGFTRTGSTTTGRGDWFLTAGLATRRAIKRRFGGNVDMAAVQCRKLIEHPAILEAWGSECIANDDEVAVRKELAGLRFSEMPEGLRVMALEALAIAYLAAGEPLVDEVVTGPVTYKPTIIDEEDLEVEFG